MLCLCVECPFHAEFVQKPFRPAVLVERLCLRHERGRLTDDAQHETDDVASPSMLQRCAPRAERILIAEDNLMNQKIIRKLLEKQGWSKITFVSNGLDAVKVNKARRLYSCLWSSLSCRWCKSTRLHLLRSITF